MSGLNARLTTNRPLGDQESDPDKSALFKRLVGKATHDQAVEDRFHLLFTSSALNEMSGEQVGLAVDLLNEYGMFSQNKINEMQRQSWHRATIILAGSYFQNVVTSGSSAAASRLLSYPEDHYDNFLSETQSQSYQRRTPTQIQEDLNYYLIMSLTTLDPTASFELLSAAINRYPWLRNGQALRDTVERMNGIFGLFRGELDEDSLAVWNSLISRRLQNWSPVADGELHPDKIKDLIREMLLGNEEVEELSGGSSSLADLAHDAAAGTHEQKVGVVKPHPEYLDLGFILDAYGSKKDTGTPLPDGLPPLDPLQIEYLESVRRLSVENLSLNSTQIATIATVQAMLNALAAGDAGLISSLPIDFGLETPNLDRFNEFIAIEVRALWIQFVQQHPELSSLGVAFSPNILSGQLFKEFVLELSDKLPTLLESEKEDLTGIHSYSGSLR